MQHAMECNDLEHLSNSPKKFSRDCRKTIIEGEYTTPTVITAAMFASQRVAIAQLAQPGETLFLNAATDRIMDEAMRQRRPDDVISTLEGLLFQNRAFRQYLTPDGRVAQVVGHTATVLAQPELKDIAFERLRRGEGMGGPSAYGAAVVLVLEVILS